MERIGFFTKLSSLAKFLTKNNVVSFLSLTYSTDLTPIKFPSLSHEENAMKDHYSNIVIEIKGKSQKILNSLTGNYFKV